MRWTNDCFNKRLGNAIFTKAMRVTCHCTQAVTRRLVRNSCHSSKAIYLVGCWCRIGSSFSIRRFVWRRVASSVGQVPYALPLSRQHMPRNFHYKRKWREMDRLATRIYCKVAVFEREHALGHEKKERRSSSWFVQTKEMSDAKRYMLAISQHVYRIHTSMIDILSCSFVWPYIERFTFSLWWEIHTGIVKWRNDLLKWLVICINPIAVEIISRMIYE